MEMDGIMSPGGRISRMYAGIIRQSADGNWDTWSMGNPYSLDSVYFTNIRNGIISFYKQGGVNTVSWHGNNPLTGGSAWDVTSKEVVASILPGGSKHELYVKYLDRLADFFLSLKTEKGTYVPVLFRPYHEHTGSWFWWGKRPLHPRTI